MARLQEMTAAVPFWAVEIDCPPPPLAARAVQPVMVWEVDLQTGRPVCHWVLCEARSDIQEGR